MPFLQDVVFAEEIGHSFGKYHSTFRSQNGQVVAQIFELQGRLVAHVSFPNELKPEEVTDPYFVKLNEFAKEQGFEGKLKIVYTE